MRNLHRSFTRRLHIETLSDRINPVVINGTGGNDTITTQLLFHPDETTPYAADILVNGTAKGQVQIIGQWDFPSTSYFIDQDLIMNGLGGKDRIEVGLLRPQDNSLTHIVLNGGNGNDTLVGGNGHDELNGGIGADDLNGGIDEDVISGDQADTRLIGGGGTDTLIFAASGNIQVTTSSLNANGHVLSDSDGTFGGFFSLVLNGSSGPDVLDASGFTSAVVEIHGNGGADLISAGSSRAVLDGGGGDDTITGSPGDDTITGGAGDDVISGGVDTYPDFTFNRLEGDGGRDTITGGTGFNTILGGAGADNLTGGPLGDVLYGEQGNDSLSGLAGNDVLIGDGDETGFPPTYSGKDAFDGGADDDILVADGRDTQFDGGDGLGDGLDMTGIRRTALLTDATLTLGTKTYSAAGLEYVNLRGSDNANTLDATGFSGSANLIGLGGNDILRAGASSAALEGGAGADALFGGPSDDVLYGDADDTEFSGGGGVDILSVSGFEGAATLTDTQLTINSHSIPLSGIGNVVLTGSEDADTIDASAFSGFASLYGLGGNDVLTGSQGGNYLSGGDGDDSLFGGAGNDTLFGEIGTDTLTAGAGEDYIDGGEGTDLLTGGADADQFVKDFDPDIYAIEQANSDFNPGEGDVEL